ncbi:MAG: sigma 54-interacting transcriptional regulator [Candidatus Rokubacteria bacterium]|nr:sigma 54-interacting transcriptional regulator [Candidatus Rokubacteria bacterium]
MAPFADLIGESPGVVAVREKISRLLKRPGEGRRLPPILIQGETGTGKGLLARGIHRAGPRAAGPFVDVNCAAIPETLLEAELFGFERGAFTDARQPKAGLFQAAHGGTIFLDEVGLLPETLQGKLLTVIEERVVRRLGSTRGEPVDVWIITASNEDLAAATRARRFREDLYHRLAVLTLWLPPLRERGQDILGLAEHFLARACADYELPPKALAADARRALGAYRWPGNIRELSNAMERVTLLGEGAEVTAEMLGLAEAAPGRPPEAQPEAVALEDRVGSVERAHLLEALRESDWNITRAASRLGISRNTLRYRIEKHGLRPGGVRAPVRREAARPAATAPAAPAVPPPVVAAPTGVRWERRRLTLLRAVVVAPAGEQSPLETSRPLEVLIEKVQSFGGRVEELSPTGLIAAFGLEPAEDAPRRAAHAAAAIQKAAQRARQGAAEQVWAVRLVIHVSEVMVGRGNGRVEIDLDSKRQAWTALEEIVAGAEADTIFVTRAAASFLERRFDLVPVGEPPAKGYRLWGRERAGLGLGGRMAAFVGRRQDLELLRSRFESAARGQGQVVGVVGEAGIGKSRLLFEFRQSFAEQAITYLEGHCFSYASDIPYFPVLDILRMSCGIAEADTPETMAEKVHASLMAAAIGSAEGAPYLLHLLGLKDGTDQLAALSPEAIKARTFEALRQMGLRLSRQNALLIVLEDLHWIDRTSEEYVASLVESVAGARILLVTTYRPGYRPSWIEKSYATQMALQPLAPEDSLSIVRSLLRAERVADSLVELILVKAEGNPFFLEELARAVREQGDLSPALEVPDTVEEVLLARIDRLPPEEKSLLQTAAVIGKDIPFRLLEAIVEMPEDALRSRLMHLRAAEFLYETGQGTEVEHTFKHALTHDVAYASLSSERRRALHARVVDAIERLHPGRLGEQIERIAHHAFRGEVWGKALTYLRQAGAKAALRSAHREAVTCFEQALVALGHLPEDHDTIRQGIDLRFGLKTSLTPLAEWAQIFDCLRQAESLAKVLGDQPRLGRVSAYASDCSRVMGDHERAIESGRRALAIAEVLEDFPLRVNANTYLGLGYYARGDYRHAIEFFRKNVESLAGELVREQFEMAQPPAVHSRVWLACCLAEVGEFTEGDLTADEALRIAGSLDHPLSLAVAYFGVGQLHLQKGDIQDAIRELEQGLELSRTWNIQLWFLNIAAGLGSAYAQSGRAHDAVPLLEEVVGRSVTMRRTGLHAGRVAALSEAYLLGGGLDDASQLAPRALDLSRQYKERGCEAWTLHLLGEIASQRDPLDVEKAEDYYAQASSLAAELGMRPLLARCHFALGKLSRRTVRRSNAERHLSAAVALFREMGMRLWLEQTQAELSGLR